MYNIVILCVLMNNIALVFISFLELSEVVFLTRLNYFFTFRAVDLKGLDSICDLIDLFLFYVYLFGWASSFEVFVHQKLLYSVTVELDLRDSLKETIYRTNLTTFELFLEV